MEAKLFWQLMEDICQLREFVAGIETSGSEINIVGTFRVTHDEIELVLEKQDCGDHSHLIPEKIPAFHLLKEARQIGYEGVRLDSARFITEAHQLYRTGGFREIEPYEGSEIPSEFQKHWIFMALVLPHEF